MSKMYFDKCCVYFLVLRMYFDELLTLQLYYDVFFGSHLYYNECQLCVLMFHMYCDVLFTPQLYFHVSLCHTCIAMNVERGLDRLFPPTSACHVDDMYVHTHTYTCVYMYIYI